ncbi:MAG: hypothetical protein ACI9BD_000392, partial [Candidatus Marinamargulisbacteria bacterium]
VDQALRLASASTSISPTATAEQRETLGNVRADLSLSHDRMLSSFSDLANYARSVEKYTIVEPSVNTESFLAKMKGSLRANASDISLTLRSQTPPISTEEALKLIDDATQSNVEGDSLNNILKLLRALEKSTDLPPSDKRNLETARLHLETSLLAQLTQNPKILGPAEKSQFLGSGSNLEPVVIRRAMRGSLQDVRALNNLFEMSTQTADKSASKKDQEAFAQERLSDSGIANRPAEELVELLKSSTFQASDLLSIMTGKQRASLIRAMINADKTSGTQNALTALSLARTPEPDDTWTHLPGLTHQDGVVMSELEKKQHQIKQDGFVMAALHGTKAGDSFAAFLKLGDTYEATKAQRNLSEANVQNEPKGVFSELEFSDHAAGISYEKSAQIFEALSQGIAFTPGQFSDDSVRSKEIFKKLQKAGLLDAHGHPHIASGISAEQWIDTVDKHLTKDAERPVLENTVFDADPVESARIYKELQTDGFLSPSGRALMDVGMTGSEWIQSIDDRYGYTAPDPLPEIAEIRVFLTHQKESFALLSGSGAVTTSSPRIIEERLASINADTGPPPLSAIEALKNKLIAASVRNDAHVSNTFADLSDRMDVAKGASRMQHLADAVITGDARAEQEFMEHLSKIRDHKGGDSGDAYKEAFDQRNEVLQALLSDPTIMKALGHIIDNPRKDSVNAHFLKNLKDDAQEGYLSPEVTKQLLTVPDFQKELMKSIPLYDITDDDQLHRSKDTQALLTLEHVKYEASRAQKAGGEPNFVRVTNSDQMVRLVTLAAKDGNIDDIGAFIEQNRTSLRKGLQDKLIAATTDGFKQEGVDPTIAVLNELTDFPDIIGDTLIAALQSPAVTGDLTDITDANTVERRADIRQKMGAILSATVGQKSFLNKPGTHRSSLMHSLFDRMAAGVYPGAPAYPATAAIPVPGKPDIPAKPATTPIPGLGDDLRMAFSSLSQDKTSSRNIVDLLVNGGLDGTVAGGLSGTGAEALRTVLKREKMLTGSTISNFPSRQDAILSQLETEMGDWNGKDQTNVDELKTLGLMEEDGHINANPDANSLIDGAMGLTRQEAEVLKDLYHSKLSGQETRAGIIQDLTAFHLKSPKGVPKDVQMIAASRALVAQDGSAVKTDATQLVRVVANLGYVPSTFDVKFPDPSSPEFAAFSARFERLQEKNPALAQKLASDPRFYAAFNNFTKFDLPGPPRLPSPEAQKKHDTLNFQVGGVTYNPGEALRAGIASESIQADIAELTGLIAAEDAGPLKEQHKSEKETLLQAQKYQNLDALDAAIAENGPNTESLKNSRRIMVIALTSRDALSTMSREQALSFMTRSLDANTEANERFEAANEKRLALVGNARLDAQDALDIDKPTELRTALNQVQDAYSRGEAPDLAHLATLQGTGLTVEQNAAGLTSSVTGFPQSIIDALSKTPAPVSDMPVPHRAHKDFETMLLTGTPLTDNAIQKGTPLLNLSEAQVSIVQAHLVNLGYVNRNTGQVTSDRPIVTADDAIDLRDDLIAAGIVSGELDNANKQIEQLLDVLHQHRAADPKNLESLVETLKTQPDERRVLLEDLAARMETWKADPANAGKSVLDSQLVMNLTNPLSTVSGESALDAILTAGASSAPPDPHEMALARTVLRILASELTKLDTSGGMPSEFVSQLALLSKFAPDLGKKIMAERTRKDSVPDPKVSGHKTNAPVLAERIMQMNATPEMKEQLLMELINLKDARGKPLHNAVDILKAVRGSGSGEPQKILFAKVFAESLKETESRQINAGKRGSFWSDENKSRMEVYMQELAAEDLANPDPKKTILPYLSHAIESGIATTRVNDSTFEGVGKKVNLSGRRALDALMDDGFVSRDGVINVGKLRPVMGLLAEKGFINKEDGTIKTDELNAYLKTHDDLDVKLGKAFKGREGEVLAQLATYDSGSMPDGSIQSGFFAEMLKGSGLKPEELIKSLKQIGILTSANRVDDDKFRHADDDFALKDLPPQYRKFDRQIMHMLANRDPINQKKEAMQFIGFGLARATYNMTDAVRAETFKEMLSDHVEQAADPGHKDSKMSRDYLKMMGHFLEYHVVSDPADRGFLRESAQTQKDHGWFLRKVVGANKHQVGWFYDLMTKEFAPIRKPDGVSQSAFDIIFKNYVESDAPTDGVNKLHNADSTMIDKDGQVLRTIVEQADRSFVAKAFGFTDNGEKADKGDPLNDMMMALRLRGIIKVDRAWVAETSGIDDDGDPTDPTHPLNVEIASLVGKGMVMAGPFEAGLVDTEKFGTMRADAMRVKIALNGTDTVDPFSKQIKTIQEGPRAIILEKLRDKGILDANGYIKLTDDGKMPAFPDFETDFCGSDWFEDQLKVTHGGGTPAVAKQDLEKVYDSLQTIFTAQNIANDHFPGIPVKHFDTLAKAFSKLESDQNRDIDRLMETFITDDLLIRNSGRPLPKTPAENAALAQELRDPPNNRHLDYRTDALKIAGELRNNFAEGGKAFEPALKELSFHPGFSAADINIELQKQNYIYSPNHPPSLRYMAPDLSREKLAEVETKVHDVLKKRAAKQNMFVTQVAKAGQTAFQDVDKPEAH